VTLNETVLLVQIKPTRKKCGWTSSKGGRDAGEGLEDWKANFNVRRTQNKWVDADDAKGNSGSLLKLLDQCQGTLGPEAVTIDE